MRFTGRHRSDPRRLGEERRKRQRPVLDDRLGGRPDDDTLMPTARALWWHSGGHDACPARHANQKLSGNKHETDRPQALRRSDVPSGRRPEPALCASGTAACGIARTKVKRGVNYVYAWDDGIEWSSPADRQSGGARPARRATWRSCHRPAFRRTLGVRACLPPCCRL